MSRMGLAVPGDPEFAKVMKNPGAFNRKAHEKSDVDSGPMAQHHTLGFDGGKAAPGIYWGGGSSGVNRLGKTVSYSPRLTASTLWPDLGLTVNGAERRGWYSRVNNWCHGGFQFRFATSGVISAGNGVWIVDLPLPIDMEHLRADTTTSLSQPIGNGTIRDDDVNPDYLFVTCARASTLCHMITQSASGAAVGNANPITWANGDGFSGSFSYPIAPGS